VIKVRRLGTSTKFAAFMKISGLGAIRVDGQMVAHQARIPFVRIIALHRLAIDHCCRTACLFSIADIRQRCAAHYLCGYRFLGDRSVIRSGAPLFEALERTQHGDRTTLA
jgi:hypothetical protein